MNLVFRIVYATHANGTHHKLALDALRYLDVVDAESWQRLFLKHAELYMRGSKAPDDEFKDFKNHVLHPRDGFWGGAPAKAESWYSNLVAALSFQKWEDAAWAAGVLSHYYTDPIQPFHTGQSEAENAIHRAAEWSINRAYDSLWAESTARNGNPAIVVPKGARWLEELMRANAVASNRHYEKLLAHYDIGKGVVDPPDGLDAVSRRIVGDLLVVAAKGFGLVLARAIAEAGIAAPNVTLTAETLLAALKIPNKMLLKRLTDAEDRRLVTAMYDELMATGTVEASLSADDRTIRDLHATEVMAVRAASTAPSAAKEEAATPRAVADVEAAERAAPVASSIPPVFSKSSLPVAPIATLMQGKDADGSAEPRSALVRLSASDDLVDAPSIGPKTAERFSAIGIRTVADFLALNPESAAAKLAANHVTARMIGAWQQQARLVMTIPGLYGTHAQLLTGAGYNTARDVATADPTAMCAAILSYAGTSEGKRVLRDGAVPDIEKIRAWIARASEARAA